MLKVKLLKETATAPTVAHPGEDVAYDLYCAEDVVIPPASLGAVHTQIAIEFDPPAGAVIKCRSGLAKQNISVEAGVIDAGYRGEVVVLIRNHNSRESGAHVQFKKGDRVAQMLKHPVLGRWDGVVVREELSDSKRGGNGFGSTGK